MTIPAKNTLFISALVIALPILIVACTAPHAYGQADERPFVMTWAVRQGGLVTIPVDDENGTYGATGEYTVDWGDGTVETISGTAEHRYAHAGNYAISITGNYAKIYLYGSIPNGSMSVEEYMGSTSTAIARVGSSPNGLLSIDQWGDVKWTSMAYAFSGARNLVYNATDVPDLSLVTDMNHMFYFAKKFNGNLSAWDVSGVTDMSYMFYEATAFNGDVSEWDVSGVTDMSRMFYESDTFNQDVSEWDVSGVTDISWMFSRAFNFNQDISSWNVSGVTDMRRMFANAISFNQDISSWDVSNVTDMSYMFYGSYSFNHDISSWDVSNVTDMSHMFQFAYKFNRDIHEWNVSNVTDMNHMFKYAETFNGNISSWNVSNVTDMNHMFEFAYEFNGNISGWDVSGVADMRDMFDSATSFNQNLGRWYVVPEDTSIVDGDSSLVVTTISAQNAHLDKQNPTYAIIVGHDSSAFEMDHNVLKLKATPVQSVKSTYMVGVTATGTFGSNNQRLVNITVVEYVPDTTPPSVSTIWRDSPSNAITHDTTLQFGIMFSEDVQNVNATDFVLTGTGNASVTHVSGSSDEYGVTVSVTADGTVTLGLAADNDIKDVSDNELTDTVLTAGTDRTYTVDTTAPTVTSIERYSPTDQNTDNQTLVYQVTFSENVTGVDTGDFALSQDSTGAGSITGLTGSGYIYNMTVSAVQDGTYNLDLASSGHGITDEASNPLTNIAPTGVDHTYTVSTVPADTTAPTLSSIERYSPVTESTDSQTLIYEVTFSEDVTGVDAADFVISQDSTGTGSTTLTGSDSVYYVTVSATQDGTYNLDLVQNHGIEDSADNPLTDTATTGVDQTYTVNTVPADTTAPTLTSIERYNPAAATTDTQTLIYEVTFSEDVTGVTQSDFVLSSDSTGTAANAVTSISGSGSQYFVTVSASSDGTYNLDLVQNHGIEDSADNPLTDTVTTGVDQTYTVNTVPADTTAPTLTSIKRYNPAAATTDTQTLVYEVTFSEDVTGVTQSDFVLSSDSTGGSDPGTGTGQFTQTESPSTAITGDQDVTDTITVSSLGNATSVSVNLNITHTYIGDLKVDLVAPDDTAKTLHNYSGSSSDDIVATYTPNFNGASISGTWTLKINDNFPSADDGVLNSWTLTINYGDTPDVPNPVTSISGSGSQYFVTVSASSDGTYNLDLVQNHGIEDSADNPLTDTATTGVDQTYTVNTVPADTTAPTLTSIKRYNPAVATTDTQTLVYKVTFSEDVTGVTQSDFVLSSDSTGTAANAVTSISGSGSQYFVTVSASSDGTYNLDLVQNHGIEDSADNPLTDTATTGVDQTYTVNTVPADTTAPTLTSIKRYNPAAATTDTQTLIYEVTFSEDVTGVTQSDFVLSSDSTGTAANAVTSISGSGSQYFVTVSASSDGTYNLDLVQNHGIEDSADNPLTDTATTGVDQTYTVNTVPADNMAPTLTSIERYNPAAATTDTQTLVYEVTFSEDVTEVDATDFALSSDSTGGVSSSQFTQTRSPAIAITAANTITDTITVPGSGTVTSVSVAIDVSHTYKGDLKIDLIAPDGTTKTVHNRSGGSADDIDQTYTPDFAGVPIAGIWTLQINDNYATADDGTLNSWTLTINSGSSSSIDTSNPVTSVSGSGDTYQVTVLATQDGTYNLDLISSGHDIEDESNNPLTDVTPTTGTDETYTVNTVPDDTTAPTLSSIERSSPVTENTDSQTLTYKVTFSEDVTGVDTTDFALSSDSTGGSSSAQFTQTRSPAIAITAANTITDTITVPGSGTVTSVSVAIDVSHTYKGDLKIDLIAPDGTTKTVHNRSGGSADDIDQTYTPDFAGVPIAGIWTLQINDNYATADDGTLNSWTLTINSGSSSSIDTSNPVTSVSGSGDTYQVTVLATQDGTYNLDLISSGHDIEDESNNPLTDVTPTTGTDETYTVNTVPDDTTAPTLSSIERSSPVTENTDSRTLTYKVTFSEDVTGVDTTDFALSSDSTGGSSSAQFTQTRSPAIAITAANTITDTITVPGSGTVTSVSVAIDVSHTYKGDLKIDLIAPDGTTKTVHNRSGGSADDIDQTYTPDFAGVPIAGIWTLQINDNYATADDGTLNSWTLTINSGSSSSIDTSNPVTSVSGSGDTYQVTVLATQDGTYNLDLISSGHDIEDESNNPLTDVTPTTGTDETYTVNTVPDDTTAPTLSSIERSSPVTENTDSQTLTYKVTFSEDVTGVDTTDFALSSDSTGGSSSAQFTQTRSPAIAITAANTITDTITVPGSGTVTSVSVAIDVSHTYKGDLKIDLIAPDGTTKTVHNRSGGSADDIDQTYTPDFAGVPIAGIWTLQINDNYATADDGTLNSWTLTINSGSSSSIDTSNPVTSVSGSGDTYQVTVLATQDGTYNLDLISSGHDIEDESNNPLTDVTPTTGTDETYTVNTVPDDTTAPTLSSIERSSPVTENTDSRTLTYKVTFSEDVTGVDTTDFALSSDSTGGSSSAQFTQTRSPAIAITAANTITDTITVPGSGTVTSVSVAIDVSHTYKGDLKIDLIAPDGTTKTVHNRSGGSADDIDQTYTPDFAGVPIAGIWTLQINDNYATADDGTLNSWTLTINSGSSSSIDTSNPVTSVSGSGDTYQVTVLATQDGTYNLDLISSGHDIEDESNNPLTDVTPTTGTDETYTVNTVPDDTTAPTLSSIERSSPVTENTDSQTLTYKVTFSEDVTGVDTTDFALSSDSTGGSDTGTGTGTGQFTQTNSPSTAITGAQDVTDTIAVSSSGNVASVSVDLNITHTYISDLKVDLVAPDGTTQTLHNRSGGSSDDIVATYTPSFNGTSISGTWTLKINDDYPSADDGILNSWTLTINYGDTADVPNPITSISGSGSQYFVTVSASSDGTYNLDLVQNHGIEDSADNPLTDTATTGVDHTYTVNTVPADTTAPTLTSIERYNPVAATTDSQILVYEVTFSEDITGVTQSDFTLSSDSTGGPDPGTGTGTGQFTQTNSPSTAITGAQDVTDTIAVSSSGNVASVSVDLNITHTYISDLKVDLVAPDGTTQTLHNRSGGSSDDIVDTYTPNFNGTSISGTWTLKINDDYPSADDGILNSWTLTINHGDPTDIHNPITSISGSGSQYFVTVSASSDGTYNLDLVQNHGIEDSADNPLTDTATTGVDHTYTVSTTPADTTSPTVSSIERHDPTSENTDSQTLVYRVTFSENVTGVDVSDFALSTGSTGIGNVTGLAGSGSAYNVTVAVTTDGTFNLDIAAGHGIIDSSGTGLVDTAPLTDHTYTVNRTASTFTPIEMIYQANEINYSNDCSTGLNGTHTITLSESDDTINSTVAVYPRTVIRIDDSTVNGPSLSNGDGFGSSVANIGDLDGDGTVDIAVGAWTSNGPEVQSGALHVIFMNADGTLKGTAEINSTATYAPYLSNGDTFGTSVAGIGDLDGDGTVDIVVGAHNDDTSGTDNGTVYVIFLNADGIPKSGTTAIDGDTANGPDLSRGDNFGRSVANIGDLDGDGTVDIAVGAHHVDDPSGTGSGALHVIFMNADGTPKGTIEINGDTANGPSLSAGDRFGASVANIGDLDGDGTVDIAVGATRDDADNDVDSGALHVIFMNADGTPKGTIEIDGDTANGPSLSGGDHFGRSVANIGDLDGDGTVDIAVGAYRDDENGTDSGALHVIFMNADGTPKGTIEINGNTANGPSLSAGDLFGSSIANIGDLDGDGTVDIAVGAHRDDTDDSTDSGALHVIFLDAIATNGNCFMGPLDQDIAAPTVMSITRSDPAVEVTNSTSLIFQVIFSEDVTGVDAGDFVLSPDSAGADDAAGQFAHTSEPSIPITDSNTIQDTIAVDQSGTATSVSVTVDITHSYIGDLKIDLIAPDGTTKTLHDRTGYDTDDIDKTYAPDFGGVGIAEDWTLRVRDGAGGDTGTLNGWMLTINHDSATSPVTSVSGSGSTYYTTVSATQDGTYNLDLVSSGHDIADESGNPLTYAVSTGADETYTVSTND